MCKVYTDVGGIKCFYHGFSPPVQANMGTSYGIIPRYFMPMGI